MVYWKGVGLSVLMMLSLVISLMLGIIESEFVFACIYASALVGAMSLLDDR